VSRRRDLDARLRSLGEIRGILDTLKNMARMEVHRLDRFLATQRRAVATIESAAADFRVFHPDPFPEDEEGRHVYLLVGSERGFCGDFNESLLRFLAVKVSVNTGASIVALGSKLIAKIGEAFPGATFLQGASVVEEVEGALVRLIDALTALNSVEPHEVGSLRVTVFHHAPQREGVLMSVLHPFEEGAIQPKSAYAPHLYLDPVVFVNGLMEQYLFARLHELLYGSLMAENQIRIAHMEAAVQRLEEKSSELLRRRHVLRQEEITEEIEVIMLSSDLLA
jgi:F-type H+-transporting ATPase subunit gamma